MESENNASSDNAQVQIEEPEKNLETFEIINNNNNLSPEIESQIKSESNNDEEADMNDEFGDFEEPQIESPPLIKIEEKKNNSNEYQINNNMNKEPLGLVDKTQKELMKLLEDLKNCISNNEKDEKADNINQKMMFDMNEINNMMMLENIQINRNFEKIPKRISSNFKEILAIVMRKQEIFKKKLPINLKVPLDQEDKLFAIKIIEDLNKKWENLNSKKIINETIKIKSPDYDFFLEELTKADFKKEGDLKKDKKEKDKFSLLSIGKENYKNLDFPDISKNQLDEIIPSELLLNLNKPLFNYNCSTILNQNFTENFKLKHPLSRKNVLKKALSNILEDNDFIFSDYKNSKENIENSENNFTLNKNINSSPEIENSIRECTLTHSLPHKKISIDGMNVFGFDIDLESKDRINIFDKRINDEIPLKDENSLKEILKQEANNQEIKNILPDYEDIFN